MRKSKLTAIDLFSGCGGLSLGVKKAGFNVISSIELDVLAAETYKLNHPKTKVINKDITKVNAAALRRELGLRKGELDLLAGCPPCQGFSSMRTFNGKLSVDDERNELIFQFMKFIDAFNPKTVMMENVSGLYNDRRLDNFVRRLKRRGYKVKYDVFNAHDYGIPQRRRRLILIASRISDVEFAEKTKYKRYVAHAIGKLERTIDSSDPLHNYPVKTTKRIKELISHIPKDGGSRTDLPDKYVLDCHRNYGGFKDVYGRMSWSSPAPTITGGCISPSKGRFLHPEEDRPITLREAALLQGFPSKYKFSLKSGRTGAALMIGNAFPPNFVKKHAEKLKNKIIENS